MSATPSPDRGHQAPALSSLCLAVAERAPLPMAAVEGAGHLVRYANPPFCHLIGKPLEQIVGKALGELLPEKDECVTLLDRVFRTGKPENHTERDRSKTHPVFWSYTMWPVMANERAAGVVIQVTETAQFHKTTLEMNEALTLGSVRQHQLAEAATSWNTRLQEEISVRTQAETALRAVRMELARVNAELEQKVCDRTAKLQETIEELEHFSYTITHDMRAPLRAMKGFGGILLEECSECLNPGRREYIRRIIDSADRMDKLIIDALQYSGAVRQHFDLEPVDIDVLLRGMLECYPEFQPPRANIHIDAPLPVVLGNKAGLTQCFSNLLGNAVKFVSPGQVPDVRVWAEVRTGAPEIEGPEEPCAQHAAGNSPAPPAPTAGCRSPAADHVRLWVEDKGIGIEKEFQDKIWQMFQQLDKSYEGTGIGLALVRKVVSRMNGTAGVESDPGHGSRFWIELKRADKQPEPNPTGQTIPP
jgi:signal transduction histidine kinase